MRVVRLLAVCTPTLAVALLAQTLVGPHSPESLSALSAGPVWVRQGPIITDPSNMAGEPTVLYEGSCQLAIPNTEGKCFKVWYSYTTAPTELTYAESPTALPGTWTTLGSALSLGGGRHMQPQIVHYGATYYLLCETDNTSLVEFTSSDGVIGWAQITYGGSGFLAKGIAGSWDDGGIYNITIAQDGPLWRLVYEAQGTGYTGYACGGATSPDLINWTKTSAGPIALSSTTYGCSGPFLYISHGRYWLWAHTNLPSDIRRFTSNIFDSLWQQYPGSLSNPGTFAFQRGSADEGVGSGQGQVADVCMVEVNGYTYMFYAALSDQVFPGTVGVNFHGIKLAIAHMTMDQIVATSEGATTSTP